MTNNETFQAALNRLNPNQKKAVETTEGPVLVLAGPGTGKTQVLSARIGYILQQGLAQPQNILCLTFTESGVNAMRQRLMSFIGSDALKVNIATFHSFCNAILREHPERFDMEDMDLITDLEKDKYLRELLDEVPIGSPLKMELKSPYGQINMIKGFFQTMQKENWSPEYVVEKSDEFVREELSNEDKYIYKRSGKGYTAGEPKTTAIKLVTDKFDKIKQAALLYSSYREKLKDKKRYTYEDMILWVLEEFNKDVDFLLDYQERYQYILVDEYQDTNGSQNEIIFNLASYWGEDANLFVVGDDDQAIYGFQGANVGNILDFHTKYASTIQVIPLVQNYRSSQVIIDSATSLIGNNANRIINQIGNIDKNIIASNPNVKDISIEPKLRVYENPFQEAIGIVGIVRHLLDQGAHPSEIAILYRKNRQDIVIKKMLEQENIPFQTENQINILTEPLIINLIRILDYINHEANGVHSPTLLFEVLHNKAFNLLPNEISQVYLTGRQLADYSYNFRQFINRNYKEDQVDSKVSESVFKANQSLEDSIKDAMTEPVYPFLAMLLTKTGITSASLASDNKIFELQCIDSFLAYVQSESEKNADFNLNELLEQIKTMEDINSSINITYWQGGSDAVKLMSMHKSKGLEFDHVLMVGNDDIGWGGSGNSFNWSLPTNFYVGKELANELSKLADKALEDEEKRRIFYVAMTRAKKTIYITFSAKNYKQKEHKVAAYVAEVFEDVTSEKHVQVFSKEYLVEKHIERLSAEGRPRIVLTFDAYFGAFIEKFRLSSSAFVSYLECPLAFYFTQYLKLPSEQNGILLYGTTMHTTLQTFFHKLIAKEVDPYNCKDALISLFDEKILKQRSKFVKNDYEYFRSRGHKVLPKYALQIPNWYLDAEPEKAISNVDIDGVPIKGFIDKLENHPGYKLVVDYKSGKFETKKLKGPKESLADAHSYWIQGAFYSLMLLHFPTETIKNVQIRFEFIEEDPENVIQPISYLPEELSEVQSAISVVYVAIKAKEFTEGCGAPDCHWCNFAKNNYRGEYLKMVYEEDER